jgi:hypothetical protein
MTTQTRWRTMIALSVALGCVLLTVGARSPATAAVAADHVVLGAAEQTPTATLGAGEFVVTTYVTSEDCAAQPVTVVAGVAPAGLDAADGVWSGSTSRGQPMSFGVANGGASVTNFKLKTNWSCSSASGTTEITMPGPFGVSGNSFSGSTSSGFAFSGSFTGEETATGAFSFTHFQVMYYPYSCWINQSGTWSAQKYTPPTPTQTRTPTLTPTRTPTRTPTPTATPRPELAVSPLTLGFLASPQLSPVPGAIVINNPGSGVINWTASKPSAATWLTISPTMGTASASAPGQIVATVKTTGLSYGVRTAEITITSSTAGVIGSPKKVAVRFSYQATLKRLWLPIVVQNRAL